MDLETLGDIGLDLIEELAKLGRPMTAIALSNHMSGGDVEGGKERSCAVPLVVMAAAGNRAGPHRQHGLATIQRLDLALLVNTEHDRTLARSHIEAHDTAHFGDQIGIGP